MDADLKADLEFPPFRLDLARGKLMQGDREIELRRRTWEVLLVLVRRAGEIVGKRELMERVWGDVVVSDQTLSTSIYELRKALGDDRRSPTFIETVHGRGFRFLVESAPPAATPGAADSNLVGREAPLAELGETLQRAAEGERQLVFVRGEAGIGKTSLVRAFLDALPPLHIHEDGRRTRLIHASAQCVEFRGAGEPFSPVISALRVLTRGSDARVVTATIRQLVPPWMAELLGAGAGRRNLEEVDAESAVRTLRLLAETLEELAGEAMLVLAFDDLQWSDVSTVDLLNMIARRTHPARLMILATIRPPDLASGDDAAGHTVGALVSSRLARLIDLGGLAEDSVATLLEHVVGGELHPDLVEDLQSWTGGNPFMLAEMIDFLRAGRSLVQRAGLWGLAKDRLADAEMTPTNIRSALEARIASFSPAERAALEVAALEGVTFEPDIVAEVASREPGGLDLEALEAFCQRLVEARGMLAKQTLPPEERAGEGVAFEFKHALYAQALRLGVTDSRARRLHGELGALHERRRDAPPHILAHHFERAGQPGRALERYAEAAAQARLRQAHPDAVRLYRSALRCLPAIAEGGERDRIEMSLRLGLGASIFGISGYADPEVAPLFERARELAVGLDERVVAMVATGGLVFAHLSGGLIEAGHREAQRLIELSEGLPAGFGDAASCAMGVATFCRGDLAFARDYLERPPAFEQPDAVNHDVYLPVLRLGALATVLAHAGDLRAGTDAAEQTISAGRSTGHAYDLANAYRQVAEYFALIGETEAAHEAATATIELADAHGFGQLRSIARVFLGWSRARRMQSADAVEMIRDAIDDLEARGYRLMRSTFCARLAEAALALHRPDEAERAVGEGLDYVAASGETRHESDLWRLRGAAARAMGPLHHPSARDALQRALQLAREQGAKLHELRALTELARLDPAARSALGELERQAGPAFEGCDLDEARRLLGV